MIIKTQEKKSKAVGDDPRKYNYITIEFTKDFFQNTLSLSKLNSYLHVKHI